MDCSTPGLLVPHCLPEFAQIHVHWIADAIQPSYPLLPSSSFAFNLSHHQNLFPVSQLFKPGGQGIGASASASVLPVNIQDWSPLGLTGLISLLSKGLSRVFSNITIQKHQFFGLKLRNGKSILELSRRHSGKEPVCQCRRHRRPVSPWVGKIPWRRKWQPTPIFLPEKSNGQRSLVDCNP